MNPALWAALGGVAALLVTLLVLGLVLLAGLRRQRHEASALQAAREDVEALRARVELLTEELERSRPVVPAAEYVITTAGTPGDTTGDTTGNPTGVPDRAVLSVTLGEPLVKAAAFGFGLRRALSAESRNRIAFEMRREVKRARKARRREQRRARFAQGRGEAARSEEAA